jgi:hypothetical protein
MAGKRAKGALYRTISYYGSSNIKLWRFHKMALFICRSSSFKLHSETRRFFVTLLKQSFPNHIMTLTALKPSSPLIKYRFVIIASQDGTVILYWWIFLSAFYPELILSHCKGAENWSFRLISRFSGRFPSIHWLIFFNFPLLWLFRSSWKQIKNESL